MRMSLAEFLIFFLFGVTIFLAQINVSSTLKVRLAGDDSYDSSHLSGYLELSEDEIRWYKLCYSYASDASTHFKAASVVCKQLGHGPPMSAETHSKYDSNETYLGYNTEWCNVNTREVTDCSFEGLASTSPSSCFGGIISVECLPAGAEEYDVALVVDEDPRSGIVLVYVSGQWGPICSGSAGDTVCDQLGYGPNDSFFDGDVQTYASPVLRYLDCDESHDTVEECSKDVVYYSTCDPDEYLKVACDDDDNRNKRRGGFSSSYLVIFVAVFIVMGISFRVSVAKARAKRSQQNPTTAPGVSSLSASVSQQRNASADYPRQQTQPSAFQVYPPSSTQGAASVPPPYPATSYQSPTAPHSPRSDPDLPSYEDALRSQRTT